MPVGAERESKVTDQRSQASWRNHDDRDRFSEPVRAVRRIPDNFPQEPRQSLFACKTDAHNREGDCAVREWFDAE
jgi:hypothetical protein